MMKKRKTSKVYYTIPHPPKDPYIFWVPSYGASNSTVNVELCGQGVNPAVSVLTGGHRNLALRESHKLFAVACLLSTPPHDADYSAYVNAGQR